MHIAVEQPEQTVSVIVQKRGEGSTVESLVARLGGVVTNDPWIISGLAAELPAKAAPELAGAAGVRGVSLDAPAVQGSQGPDGELSECIDTSRLAGLHVQAIGATRLWNEEPCLQGQSITVPVADSGVAPHDDLGHADRAGRSAVEANLSSAVCLTDKYGHGTHVADIVAGDGYENTYGDLAGDDVLAGIGRIIRETISEYDIAGRFGGKQFIILLPEAGPVEARSLPSDSDRRLRVGDLKCRRAARPSR